MHGVGLSVAGSFAIAASADADDRVGSIFSGNKAVPSRLRRRKGQIRRVNLKVIVAIDPPDPDVDHAGAELNLYGVVIQVQKRNASFGPYANHRRSQLQFGAGIIVYPELIAGGHGPVGNCSHPFVFARRLK